MNVQFILISVKHIITPLSLLITIQVADPCRLRRRVNKISYQGKRLRRCFAGFAARGSPLLYTKRLAPSPCMVGAGIPAYTGRFFRPPFSLCACPCEGPPYVCAVSPVAVPSVSVACAALLQATNGRQESAAATPPATGPLVAMPPPARRRRA